MASSRIVFLRQGRPLTCLMVSGRHWVLALSHMLKSSVAMLMLELARTCAGTCLECVHRWRVFASLLQWSCWSLCRNLPRMRALLERSCNALAMLELARTCMDAVKKANDLPMAVERGRPKAII